jgi:hypothetical protein
MSIIVLNAHTVQAYFSLSKKNIYPAFRKAESHRKNKTKKTTKLSAVELDGKNLYRRQYVVSVSHHAMD